MAHAAVVIKNQNQVVSVCGETVQYSKPAKIINQP